MTASKATIREECEWNEYLYTSNKEKLDDNDVGPEGIVSALSMVAGSAEGVGICKLYLGHVEEGRERFAEATQYNFSFDDAVSKYEDSVTGSRLAHRPTHYMETLHAAILSGEKKLVRQATERVLEMDEDQYLDEWGDFEFHHVLYYVKALAHLLEGDSETSGFYLQKLDELDHGFENFEALWDCLNAVVAADRQWIIEGLTRLLEWHDDEYGMNPSAATDFISVDATALLVLARRNGLDVGPADFDESLREHLPTALFEE